MSFIIDHANPRRKNNRLGTSNKLYRGLKLTEEEVDGYQVGGVINLTGYTSTSTEFDCAFEFSQQNCQHDQLPVVFEIQFLQNFGLFYLSSEYTAYPDEDEVLIQDGLQYQVLESKEMIEEQSGKKYVLIRMRHPVESK